MGFKIGDKVKLRNAHGYAYDPEIPNALFRHGSTNLCEDRLRIRFGKIVNVYVTLNMDVYYIIRMLDMNLNYIDLPYKYCDLSKNEECEPNVIPVFSFGNCLPIEFNLDERCDEIKFDNFNPLFYVGKSKSEIYLFKIITNSGTTGFCNRFITRIYHLPKDGSSVVKISNKSERYSNIVGSVIKLNHRPLILKKSGTFNKNVPLFY